MSMKTFKSWRWLSRKKSVLSDGGPYGAYGIRSSQFTFMVVVLIAMLFIVYRITTYQYEQTENDARQQPFDSTEESETIELAGLPQGIVHSRSDLELKPLWSRSKEKVEDSSSHNLLAIAAGIKQKENVDAIVQKFLAENFTVVLFHYDGERMDGGIWIGVTMPFISLLRTKQNDGLQNAFYIRMLFPSMTMYFCGMKI